MQRDSLERMYTKAGCYQFESKAFENEQLGASVLMQRAGQESAALVQFHYPNAKKIAVFCGKGNNAGDGYVCATQLYQMGLDITIISTVQVNELKYQNECLRRWYPL